MEKTAKREIAWAGTKGEIKATVTVGRGVAHNNETLNLDGDKMDVTTKNTVEYASWTVEALGQKFEGAYLISGPLAERQHNVPAYFANNTRPLVGIKDKAILDRLMTAKKEAFAEAEANNPEWDAIAKNRRVRDEYEAHSRRVDSMMTLGGRTY